MKVLSINLGTPKTLLYRGKTVKTGIFKTPTEGPQTATFEGFIGDHQADLKHHGGPDKAIYVYDQINLGYWALKRGESDYPPGHLGENLTVTGMEDENVHLGDVFVIGTTELQVTQPRVPCFKLGVKLKDAGFVGDFLRSGRTGFYLRVLKEGTISAGDTIMKCREDPAPISIKEAMKCLIQGPEQRLMIERVLANEALSLAWRLDLQDRFATHHAADHPMTTSPSST